MRLLQSLVPALALLASSGAIAQTAYPDRPIRMIVPLAAASAVDVAARIVTQKMADNMGQQFVIMNQPGASGLIGAEAVARAEPDGYTIGGFNDSIMTMVPNLQSKMRWDILKDFEPVSLVATLPFVLFASPLLPACEPRWKSLLFPTASLPARSRLATCLDCWLRWMSAWLRIRAARIFIFRRSKCMSIWQRPGQ